MIPFLDLKAATEEIRSELDEAYRRFMDSGWYVLGQEVEQFENEYRDYCEAQHCVGVATGLDALELALRAIGVGPGDEVIVPSNTYIASWLAVTQVGATIVSVEPCELTRNLDPLATHAAITPHTKAIMPVNLYGLPVDYDAFMSLADQFNLKIVIDNAQSQGASYTGLRVGGIAHIECHSFYPSKNLGAYGEAGAVTTVDAGIADKIRVLRNYGSRERYHNEICGTNSRLDALQAAFLRVKLKHLDTWNDRRRVIAKTYFETLSGIPSSIKLPTVPEWADPVWHLFVIETQRRDELRSFLTERAIGTQIHYPIPPHESDAYRSLAFRPTDFAVASRLAQQSLSIPVGPHLRQDDACIVSKAIEDFFKRTGSSIEM